MPKIPDRWLNYSAIGSIIPKTRFITFKVPLRNEYFLNQPEEVWFTPEILLETVTLQGHKLGLVIDLTFTKKYYYPKDLSDSGVLYKKVFVEGHKIPSQKVIKEFYRTVDDFLAQAGEDCLVGVHCTHGVNRTGYLVCRYMIERLGIPPNEALKAYEKARGYPVERENYIKDLKGRSKIEDYSPTADQEEEDIENPHSNTSNHHQVRSSESPKRSSGRRNFHRRQTRDYSSRRVDREGEQNDYGTFGHSHDDYNYSSTPNERRNRRQQRNRDDHGNGTCNGNRRPTWNSTNGQFSHTNGYRGQETEGSDHWYDGKNNGYPSNHMGENVWGSGANGYGLDEQWGQSGESAVSKQWNLQSSRGRGVHYAEGGGHDWGASSRDNHLGGGRGNPSGAGRRGWHRGAQGRDDHWGVGERGEWGARGRDDHIGEGGRGNHGGAGRRWYRGARRDDHFGEGGRGNHSGAGSRGWHRGAGGRGDLGARDIDDHPDGVNHRSARSRGWHRGAGGKGGHRDDGERNQYQALGKPQPFLQKKPRM